MSPSSDVFRRGLTALGAAIPLIILMIAALSLPLTAAQAMNLSTDELNSWILVQYGLCGLLSLLLSIRYRQPLIVTGNVFILIFIVSLGDQLEYAELIGACMMAGVGVLIVTVLGLVGRLMNLIPAPIVLGLLAGVVTPFIADTFTALGGNPLVLGGTVLAYILSRWLLGARVPAVLPAIIVGVIIAALSGQLGQFPTQLAAPMPIITTPVFSLPAIIAATPVFIILLTVQSNLPSMVFLRTQGYQPPERTLSLLSGFGTALASLLGPTGVSLSLPATALVAGPSAGELHTRRYAAYAVAGTVILVGLLAGVAAQLPAVIPPALFLAFASVALIDVLVNSLHQIFKEGVLVLGPVFAFVVAISEISLLGLGPLFWALVFGTGVSFLLERDGVIALRNPPVAREEKA